jgi:peptide/nickel transport system substrate-binding protein
MMTRSLSKLGATIVAAGLAVLGINGAHAQSTVPIETPSLAESVKAGKLPPVAMRLPQAPRVIDPREHGGTLGRHGGRMRWLMGKPKDLRMVAYYGYARLICYSGNYSLVPDILDRYEVEEGRIFTLHLRPGHKWSDGHPFTTEDFRYVWEDLYHDKRMGKRVPQAMLVDGEEPTFEVLSETAVRYAWSKPNPQFIGAIAGTLPIVLAMPAHYVKQFHPRYADKKELAAKLKAARVSSAKSLHKRMTRAIAFKNPKLPVLAPWINTTEPPSGLFIFKRNPFYHRVDPAGRQLPYIDEIDMSIGSRSLIPAKTGSGDSDLQARYLRFDDYTFLKAAERKGKVKVHLWEKANGSHMAIIPNLNTKDDTWRKLFRDVRMRRALSLAINRTEINEAIFFGLARPSGDTVLPSSPLYKEKYRTRWIDFDLEKANALLDELGLDKRGYDGIRKLPDGRRAEIILDTAGESSEQSDVLALIKDTWRKIGIAMYPRPTQRDLFRKRVYSGTSIMSVWSGHNNGVPVAGTSPQFLAPISQAQLQWPDWGLYTQTSGKQGTPPDLPAVKKLSSLLEEWRKTTSTAEQTRVWHQMLDIYSDNLFTIGILNGTKQPVVTAPTLHNVPATGMFAFDPGGYFGLYHPDTFWQANTAMAKRASPPSTAAKGR